MKNILITGASGFIGSHTCWLLLNDGYEIFALDSEINSCLKVLYKIKNIYKLNNQASKNNFHIFKGDVRDKNILKKIFTYAIQIKKPIRSVIHFAGLKSVNESFNEPLEYWDININGVISLIKIMKIYKCKTIVFSSSASVYASESRKILDEDSPINPISPYGKTKHIAETILNDLFVSSSGWRIANLRYFNPIGAHKLAILGEMPLYNKSNIFPKILEVASGSKDYFEINGKNWPTKDGTCIRDYIHIEDLVEGHIKTLEYLSDKKSQFLNLNLGTGIGTSVLELIKIFEKANNLQIPYIFSTPRFGESPILIADNKKAKKILNWSAKKTVFQMCRDGWNWYKLGL